MTKKIMQLHTFPDQQTLTAALAEHLAAALRRDIAAQGWASLAVSGGSTPVPLFERLSELDIPWQNVLITLVDERWVEASSPDSNEALVRRCLLKNRAAAATFVGLKTAAATAAVGAADCEARLAALPRPCTAVILGMGNDGHTASLFPCAPQLAEAADLRCGRRCAALRPQTAPHERISLTLPALLDTREIILHITGPEKKAVLEQALSAGLPEEMPVRFILRQQAAPVAVYWTVAA
ncbi:MAG: 6-phosphogluconolactonase [Candidatus Electronema sp. V4]|uniref:6-phosphogluconolactonase n=1 Tax=Candidatus Electronema sp. V4 TaxID=3454756 RepID=UPI0040558F4D